MRTRIFPCHVVAAVALTAAVLASGCGSDKPEALVASAKDYLARNDRSAAVIQLKNALAGNPNLAEARFLLGKSLLENGDTAAAEKELNKALELGYPFDRVAPVLARAILSRGDVKKVIADFEKAEVTSPASKADLKTTLAIAYMATFNFDAAREGLAAALAAVPDYPPALLGQARMAAVNADFPSALALTEAVLARAPTYTEAWMLKGDIVSVQGDTDAAVAAYRKAVETRPGYLRAHSRVVVALLRAGKSDEAAKQLEAMKKIAPKDPQTLYLQALYSYQKNDFFAARDAIQQQLRLVPDNVSGLVLDSGIELKLGAYAQSEASLQKVLTRAPDHKLARSMLINTYLVSGQPRRALDALRPLLETNPDDAEVMAAAAEVYMQNGDARQAARYNERAAQLDPKSARNRAALALSHMALGDTDVGFRELQEAAAADTGTRTDLALIAVATNARKFDAALAAVDELEKKQPSKPLAHNLRAGVLVAKGDKDGARKSFEKALALNATDFTAVSGLAKLDLIDKKPADARKRFEDLVAKEPKNSFALLALAELRTQEGGKSDEVASLISKAIAANPTDATPRLALISYYMRSNDAKKAAAVAQDALVVMPDRADVLYAAAQAQQAAGEPNQAARTYNKLSQVRPDSTVPFVREAESQFAAKDYEGAIANLKKALALKPDLVEAQRRLIGVYLATGRVPDALAVAREVQKQRPKEMIGFGFEGDIYVSQKSWKEATAAYQKGLKVNPTTELAARFHAALRAGGQSADADKFASSWLNANPKDREFRTFLAESAMAKGDIATAVRHYQALLEQNPNDALALNNLAYLSSQNKDPKAIEYAEKANKLVPNNPNILDTLGVLLVDKGETKRGIDSLQQATTLAPNAPEIRLNLARALVKDGQKDAAKKELEVLAKLGDRFPAQAEVTKLMQGL